MAKGQKRGNRELRKQKKPQSLTAPVALAKAGVPEALAPKAKARKGA